MTPKHTPTPWTVNFKGSADIVADFGGNDIAIATIDGPKDKTHHLIHEEHQANAAFIVRACNAHDALVGACKYVSKRLAAGDPVGNSLEVLDYALKLAQEVK